MGTVLVRLAALALSAALTLTGCGGKTGEREEQKMTGGTLAEVEYSFRSGTMWGADFSIQVNAREVVSASFFHREPEGGVGEKREEEHLPISAEMWRDITRAVEEIRPLLEPAEPRRPSVFAQEQIMDGGDETRFFLTWEKDGEEERVAYCVPNDYRANTLFTLLAEAADPIGREIVWYGAPVLEGVYFCRDSGGPGKKFSYQCTKKGEEEGLWRFYAYFPQDGETAHWYGEVDAAVWERVKSELERLRVEEQPKGSGKEALYCTLYMSDGKQPRVVPDRDTAEALGAFFRELTDELRGGN